MLHLDPDELLRATDAGYRAWKARRDGPGVRSKERGKPLPLMARIPDAEQAEMHATYALPGSWWEMPYEASLEERRVALADVVRRAFERLATV